MLVIPSQVVDNAWHELILFTLDYLIFFKKGIGRFLHHSPTQSMRTQTLAEADIKRTWRLACTKESINPDTPAKFSITFAIDSLLQRPGGFSYSLNCLATENRSTSDGYCASQIGCSTGCSGDSDINNDSAGLIITGTVSF